MSAPHARLASPTTMGWLPACAYQIIRLAGCGPGEPFADGKRLAQRAGTQAQLSRSLCRSSGSRFAFPDLQPFFLVQPVNGYITS